jgi:hypothetical protein
LKNNNNKNKTMEVNYCDNIKYTGFKPYREENLVTNKPINKNIYSKDFYNDISGNKKTKIPFFDKESRWQTNYNSLIIGSLDEIKKENYKPKKLNPLSKIYYLI